MNIEWPALPDSFWYYVAFAYGAIVGSFLNVVIYRLPLGKHLSKPASHCPNCNHLITFWENIPLLSFLFLRARCSDCKAPISWRYFCVELFTGCFWALLYHTIVLPYQQLTTWHFIFAALVSSVLIALVFIDLDHFLAPDELTRLALILGIGRDIACGIAAVLLGEWPHFAETYLYFGWLPISVAGAALYGGLLFLVSFLGFVLYARVPGESFLQTARRFFVDEAPETESGMALVDTGGEGEDGSESAPPRLAFSPLFLCALSFLSMAPLIPTLSPVFLLIPLTAFFFMTRRADETPLQTIARFGRSDDLGLPASASEEVAAAAAEADQFAREAETGQHGAMGLGDVKLALGLGAILGPGLAVLSLVFATFLGATVGGYLAFRRGRSMKYGIPFVPFMAAGAMLTMCYGPLLIENYRKIAFPEKKDDLHLDIRGPKTRQRMGLPPLKPGQ
ncbi:prepilin peptidase [Armatimonas rosea]|uniref:Leader peptidase (Prepilin peptidase)/N-methyltransferase n=1 Tax=Armatimonas rosea TaxID=685828 RepID=A0A7W9STS0_ARMRO|nr:prepilin peptidase [Armatimonas rosea]MBB6051883.1 leader peptidase (prepilin peptidase)/N-methyltransferase [Armatimonas rosea]